MRFTWGGFSKEVAPQAIEAYQTEGRGNSILGTLEQPEQRMHGLFLKWWNFVILVEILKNYLSWTLYVILWWRVSGRIRVRSRVNVLRQLPTSKSPEQIAPNLEHSVIFTPFSGSGNNNCWCKLNSYYMPGSKYFTCTSSLDPHNHKK